MQAYIPDRLLKKGVRSLPEDKLAEFADSDSEENDDIIDAASETSEAHDDALEGDCYFPPDGYDYEQHLAYINEDRIYKTQMVASVDRAVNAEQAQILEALNDDDGAYEEADDDIFDELTKSRPLQNDTTLLWGDFKPSIPEVFLPKDDAVEPRSRRVVTAAPKLFSLEYEIDDEWNEDDWFDESDHSTQDHHPISKSIPVKTCTAQHVTCAKTPQDEFETILMDYVADDSEDLSENEISPEDAESIERKLLELGAESNGSEDEEEAFLENAKRCRALLSAMPKDDEDLFETLIVRSKKDKWDCESILSLRSNLTNHPGRVPSTVGGFKRTRAVSGPKPGHRCSSLENEEQDDLSWLSGETLSKNSIWMPLTPTIPEDEDDEVKRIDFARPADETPEEKKARKAAVKEQQRLARADKKANAEDRHRRQVFKQRNNAGNGDIRNNLARQKM